MKRNRQMKTNLELHMNVLCSWHNDLDSKTKETYMYIRVSQKFGIKVY